MLRISFYKLNSSKKNKKSSLMNANAQRVKRKSAPKRCQKFLAQNSCSKSKVHSLKWEFKMIPGWCDANAAPFSLSNPANQITTRKTTKVSLFQKLLPSIWLISELDVAIAGRIFVLNVKLRLTMSEKRVKMSKKTQLRVNVDSASTLWKVTHSVKKKPLKMYAENQNVSKKWKTAAPKF